MYTLCESTETKIRLSALSLFEIKNKVIFVSIFTTRRTINYCGLYHLGHFTRFIRMIFILQLFIIIICQPLTHDVV